MATSTVTSAYASYVKDLRAVEKEKYAERETLSWSQVCKALCPPTTSGSKGKGNASSANANSSASAKKAISRTEVPIVDVVHQSSDGLHRQWFFTSRTGRISRKSKKNSGFRAIYATFQDIAKSYGVPTIAVIRRGTTEIFLPDEGLEAFQTACKCHRGRGTVISLL